MILFLVLAFFLPGCASVPSVSRMARSTSGSYESDMGRLAWGRRQSAELQALASTNGQDDLSKQLRNVIRKAKDALQGDTDLPTVEKIDRERVLPSDPRFQASEQAIQGLNTIFYWAICARVATAVPADNCMRVAQKNILKWVAAYKTDGNSINDQSLLPLFLAIDLLRDSFSKENWADVDRWLKAFAQRGDERWASIPATWGHHVNNHKTWRLAIRAIVGRIVADEVLNSESRKLIAEHIQNNLIAPENWKPDPNCENNRDELKYGGFDFRQRDALHYHIYNLKAWAWLMLFAPEFVTGKSEILEATEFLEPYFSGIREHREFVCSKIPFDLERKAAGIADYQNVPWNPKQSRQVLRLLMPVFPEIRRWASSVETVDGQEYAPWVKVVAAMKY